MRSFGAELWKIELRSLKSRTRPPCWRNECVKYWMVRRPNLYPPGKAIHEQRHQPGLSRSVPAFLPTGMDQVGAGAGVDHGVDGDRVVHVHELLGAAGSSQPLDRLLDVLFGVPRGVDRLAVNSTHAALSDGLAGVHLHPRAVHVFGQFPTDGGEARPTRTRAGKRDDGDLELRGRVSSAGGTM